MSAISQELELELAHELEHEASAESAHEAAHEQEAEHEAFFNHLAAMADRSGSSQALRRIALTAARQALRTQPVPGPGIEGEFEQEFEALGESEYEAMLKVRTPQQVDAMLEHLGHTAAEASNEQEAAEHFLPLIPLAAKALLPIAGKMLMPLAKKAVGAFATKIAPQIIKNVAPTLTRAVSNVTRTLFRSPTARPLLHAMPKIAKSTVAQIAQRASRGLPVNRQVALRTFARNTYRTLSNPRSLVNSYQRSLRADRRHHSRVGRLVGSTPSNYRRGPYRGGGYGGGGLGGYAGGNGGTQTGYNPGGAPAGSMAAPGAPSYAAPGVPGYPVSGAQGYPSGPSGAPIPQMPFAVPPGAGPSGVCYWYSLAPR
jgi:hypothetical protein